MRYDVPQPAHTSKQTQTRTPAERGAAKKQTTKTNKSKPTHHLFDALLYATLFVCALERVLQDDFLGVGEVLLRALERDERAAQTQRATAMQNTQATSAQRELVSRPPSQRRHKQQRPTTTTANNNNNDNAEPPT